VQGRYVDGSVSINGWMSAAESSLVIDCWSAESSFGERVSACPITGITFVRLDSRRRYWRSTGFIPALISMKLEVQQIDLRLQMIYITKSTCEPPFPLNILIISDSLVPSADRVFLK
jgi:hypothetical protein